MENIKIDVVDTNYNSYLVSKAYRYISTQLITRETESYARLYIDTIGPINPSSYSSKRYMLGITEDTDRVRYVLTIDLKEALNEEV